MRIFGSMKEKVGKGLDWGKDTANDAMSAVANKVNEAGDWAGEKADQAGTWAGQKVDQAGSWAGEKADAASAWAGQKVEQAKDAVRDKEHKFFREQAKNAVKNDSLLKSLDQRKNYTAKTKQDCVTSAGPPVRGDGQFLGKHCKVPTTQKPKPGEGRKPKDCEKCADGTSFPQVTFTNGIDNTLHDMCNTMKQLANDLCMEVIGVFNASYNEAVPPTRSAKENMALLTAGRSGAVDGIKKGVPKALATAVVAGLPGAFASLGKSAVFGTLMGTGKELLIQQAPRQLPNTQDALDTIDTLKGRSSQPATITLADDIANQLRDGKPVNLIGHSEGGVNVVAAIGQAKRKLIDEETDKILSAKPGLNPKMAIEQASRGVEESMAKNMNVTLLGTQQTGLPSGPNYTRIAHKGDIIPDAISGAQDAIGFPGHDSEPQSNGKPSPPVERFPRVAEGGRTLGTDQLNPSAAHNMITSYSPYLREKTGRKAGASCC